jgi:hypothetical protein
MTHPLPIPPLADLSNDRLPIFGDAFLCAQVASHRHGAVSPRTIRERWNLEWRIVNGRAVTHMPTFLAEAQRRFDESRIGSRRRATPARARPETLPHAA